MHRLATLLLCVSTLNADVRQVAITFDDLPRGGDTGGAFAAASTERLTQQLLRALDGLPVAGFVNAGAPAAKQMGGGRLRDLLRAWCAHGAVLGNHTYSHPDLNRTPAASYKADIVKGEPAIREACGRRPEYFRHPFLHTGQDAAVKQDVERFLRDRGYRVAPVTLDNSDYLFAFVYAHALRGQPELARRVRTAYLSYMESIFAFFESRSVEVTGREFAQVLLLHVNQLNADAMPELLRMIRGRGYQVVSLERALRDPAYRLPDHYVGPGGFSWIHRWSRTKGLPPKGEPDPPEWVDEYFRRYREQ